MRSAFATAIFVLTLSGCATYEHSVTAPPAMAVRISKDEQRIDRDELIYWLRTCDNRLVLRIENAGPQTVRMIGEDSWLVTPDGQSRLLFTQVIAPASYIELILPSPGRRDRGGPRIGIGVGVGSDFGGGPYVGPGIGVGTEARNGGGDWAWPPGREVRIRLTFRRDETPLTHDWTFTRQRT